MSYYNTTEETGDDLDQSHKKAKKQDHLIYSHFILSNELLSPSMVLDRLNLNCPITSVRRAMTNLTNEGKLIKTDQYVKGKYGKREHLWSLNIPEGQQEMNLSK